MSELTALHPAVEAVTARIVARSSETRADYLSRMEAARREGPARAGLSCSNLAHVIAAAGEDKPQLAAVGWPNIGIVTAYNDMLSAHQPYEDYPKLIRAAARAAGATAQVAGGVPAMCDGVTQGTAGMELSLFSRDVIAMATAVSLSHNAFDAAIMLGICDKIVPGLFIGAAVFGHLPVLFVPAGPMPSGLPNSEKAKIRQRYAEGLASRDELLAAESAAYHDAGTCTFYGTANSNQMAMEMMGLHMPGAAFVPPKGDLRRTLTEAAVAQAARSTPLKGGEYRPFARVVDERSIVNAIVGLMATGGSTNHAIHLVAMARACGIMIDWTDLAELSAATPLIARIYPNGQADVNHFHAAGGVGFVTRELLSAGLLHGDVETVFGPGLAAYTREPVLEDGELVWRDAPERSLDESVLRSVENPFSPEGGLRLLEGNLGRSVIKVSAVASERWLVTAPARVFDDQSSVDLAFRNGELDQDFIAVVRFQGPSANGMPELHKLMPLLGSLQDRGRKVALVTDGRLSGASGKVPAALHVTPEAAKGGMLAKLRTGDIITLDAISGRLDAHVEQAELASRPSAPHGVNDGFGQGRELFAAMRERVSSSELGASALL
jgi:phosphogluconate dehydratase